VFSWTRHSFFNYGNVTVWYRWHSFISFGSIIAKLFKNKVFRQYIPSKRRSRYQLLQAQRVNNALSSTLYHLQTLRIVICFLWYYTDVLVLYQWPLRIHGHRATCTSVAGSFIRNYVSLSNIKIWTLTLS